MHNNNLSVGTDDLLQQPAQKGIILYYKNFLHNLLPAKIFRLKDLRKNGQDFQANHEK